MRTLGKIRSDISIDVEPDELIEYSNVTFHESIRFLVITAQFFGVMPLQNITKDGKKVSFNWRSFGVLYSLSNSIAAFIGFFFWVIKFGRDGLYIDKTGKIEYYICRAQFIDQLFCMKILIGIKRNVKDKLNEKNNCLKKQIVQNL